MFQQIRRTHLPFDIHRTISPQVRRNNLLVLLGRFRSDMGLEIVSDIWCDRWDVRVVEIPSFPVSLTHK